MTSKALDMRRRDLLALLCGSASVAPFAATAQQQFVRIGWVTAQQASSLEPYVDAFRSGLGSASRTSAAKGYNGVWLGVR